MTSSSNMQVLGALTSVMSDLAQDGAKYAVSGRIRSKQMVSMGIALRQSSKSVFEMVEIDLPLDDRSTISLSRVATSVVPFRIVGNGCILKAWKVSRGMRGIRMCSASVCRIAVR